MIVTIKRYANRKLYNTVARKYVKLDDISELIRSGAEIEVLDNDSGEDLTALILTQIIYEQEKKQGGFLPRPVLQSLVQSGGETLNNLRTGLASSLNLMSHVDDEIRRRVDTLIKGGEIALEDGQKMIQNLVQNANNHLNREEGRAADFFDRLNLLGVPSRSEINDLKAQIEALEQAMAALGGDETAAEIEAEDG